MSLQIEFEYGNKALIVRLKGELDHHTADTVRRRMEEAIEKGNCNHMILNMEQLSFMDSSGLGVILGRYKQITAKGGKLIVCGMNAAVQRLFHMSGLFKIVDIADNERLAISRLEVVS